MGLDMYLFKTNKYSCVRLYNAIIKAREEYEKQAIDIGGGHLLFINPENKPNPINALNPKAYWIKANHIHKWFSVNVLSNKNNIETKVMGWVSKKQLVTLVQRCQTVLDHCHTASGEIEIDKSYCRRFFPPSFHIPFGGETDYDEQFINNLKNTIEQINEILRTTDFEKEAVLYFAYY